MPRFRRLQAHEVDTKAHAEDLVTIADRKAEEAMTRAIKDLIPGVSVVGEEAVSENPKALERLGDDCKTVLLDPIDGTWNFAAGIAMFGVILAVVEKGRVQFGLLYDPVMDDWIMARCGKGVWFARPNSTPLRLQTPRSTVSKRKRIYTRISEFRHPDDLEIFHAAHAFGRVESLGCSCHEYRTLATGHADAIVAPSPMPWDHAAGMLTLKELGGGAFADYGEYDALKKTNRLVASADLAVSKKLIPLLS